MKAPLCFLLALPLAAQPQQTVELGYRYADVHGNQDAYRSFVNLGDGPKLFSADLFYKDLKLKLDNWGGDPYSSIRLEAQREKLYRLTWQYRNVAYYDRFTSNFFDLKRQWSDVEFELLTNKTFKPFVAWTHDRGKGRTVTNFVVDGNEYPVAGNSLDRTETFRGGVHIDYSKWRWTLEQGGTVFRQDDTQSTTDRNTGDRTLPYLGQQLVLNSLNQTYSYNGHTIYSRGAMAGNPFHWLTVTGYFTYSQPQLDGQYNASAAGRFISFDTLTFQNTLIALTPGMAKQPHTTGSFTAEMKPVSRVRIVESWFTDRFHDLLLYNGSYSQFQSDLFVEVTKRLTLRAGERSVWGETGTRGPTLPGPAYANLRRNVGIAGINYRFTQKLMLNADYEASPGDKAFYRTSLNEYHRSRVRGTWRPSATTSVSASSQILENTNGPYSFSSRTHSINLAWSPKRFTINTTYGRSAVRSEVPLIVPQEGVFAPNLFRENSHFVGAYGECGWHGVRFSLGGTAFLAAGSRPTNFYQPYVRVLAPVRKHMAGKAEWRWNGYASPVQAAAFGANLVQLSLVLTQ